MIRALESHLAVWAEAQLAELARASDLYGRVAAFPGLGAPPPGYRAAAEGQIAVLFRVESLVPAHAPGGVSAATVADRIQLPAQARIAMRVLGPASPEGPVPVAEGAFFTTDLVALTLLALLRERQVPGPDQGGGTHAGPAGTAVAERGARRVDLSWADLQAVEAVPSEPAEGLRQWEVALQATCLFTLTPAPLAGGRILQVQKQMVVVSEGSIERRER